MNPMWLTVARHVVTKSAFFLPKPMQTHLERKLRGREDYARLRDADCVIVSFGKSGRTWLRVMLSRFFQIRFNLPQSMLLVFDNFHRRNPDIPRIFFTHDNYLKDFTGQADSKSAYEDKKVVLLVRDPADVAVSQYYQWQFRMTPRKKRINNYPIEQISLFDFVMSPTSGLPKVIDFMNGWARDAGRIKDLLVVRYEDMRSNTEDTLRRIIDFIGVPATTEQVKQAVAYASVENMRALEQKRVFWLSGTRMKAADSNNPNSFKVRKAKVGGYRDEFTPAQLREIDALVEKQLIPTFGYVRNDMDAAATGT
ncbi:sulfotransferase domain-containing protein [Defluviicoccus vanus]|uniref:Sulfotransferase domain-containing protein n=1 Tax=Defluviicoccus vanus TaxID=111831 RepID=A0A7H1MZS6_9PROT|nr:sulfotransferase domain-containing protein [Defluviicoccus vanus]QNT68962.1 sulfotransferase domain-containing protein [Defluviicoccus vanus]